MILVTGGSASGKSAFAERLLTERSSGGRTYLATMTAAGGEAAERIARHRKMREGAGFKTVECPVHISDAVSSCGEAVLLEDLGNLVANEMFADGGCGENAADEIGKDLLLLDEACSLLVVVTDEVFSDGGEYGYETRQYLRELGRLNCFAAAHSREVWEVVCGIPLRRK